MKDIMDIFGHTKDLHSVFLFYSVYSANFEFISNEVIFPASWKDC
jgi:hypothetical protein